MYFKDFDNYSYGTYYGPDRIIPLDEVKMIGWLENGHDYPKGVVDEQTLYYLRELIVTQRAAEISYRGYHYCDFCERQSSNLDEHPKVKLGSQERSLGCAEFWLPSLTAPGTFYSAPNLIYHYIVDHGYRPPDEFLEAVNRFPFNLQWNASSTRQQLVEKHRQRIRDEENKPKN